MQCSIYEPRTYRACCQSEGRTGYVVCVRESDLYILADRDIRLRARHKLTKIRNDLEMYIHGHPEFSDSLEPVQIKEPAPRIARCMADAGAFVRVGPMAAVAGAISEEIARDLHVLGHDSIVENGGDIYAYSTEPLKVALYAGASALSMKVGLIVKDCQKGMSVCTSSGSVGHSMSFGNADAVTVVARSGALADATATALGNIVHNESDIDGVLAYGAAIEGVLGAVIIVGDSIGIKGEKIELCVL
ncbi:UPF0280 family protein [candidate division WOR-3 bacterium]|nr:UPF0280 family protein [candidate division WOR-3 bacterium]